MSYRLVECHNRRFLEQVGLDTDRFDIVQSRGRVETTGRAIPHIDTGSDRHLFRDGKTLAITTRDTTNERVTDLGLDLARQSVHLGQNIEEFLNEFATMFLEAHARGFGLERCFQGLTDSQGRVMEVICCVFFWKQKQIGLDALDH